MLRFQYPISFMEPGRPLAELYQQCLGSKRDSSTVAGERRLACDEFFATLHPILKRVASRVAFQYGASQDIEDLIQEMNLKVINSGDSILAALPREQPAVAAYFAVLAANCARDYFRVRHAIKRGADATVGLDDRLAGIVPASPMDGHDRSLLVSQIEDALPHDKRESTIFRLYYRQGFTMKEIASIPAFGLSIKGVESAILRMTNQVRQRLGTLKTTGARRGMADRQPS